MKIIGITEVGEGYSKSKAYVAIISQYELAKVADKASYSRDGSAPDPKVGDDYQIAEGHDFRSELLQAIKAMQEAYTKFAKVAPVAARFAGLTLSDEERGATPEAKP